MQQAISIYEIKKKVQFIDAWPFKIYDSGKKAKNIDVIASMKSKLG